MEFFQSISDFIYGWLLNPEKYDYQYVYDNYAACDGGGSGMLWGFVAVLAIPLLAVLLYYFVIARDLGKATRKTYLTVFCCAGALTLAAAFMIPWQIKMNAEAQCVVQADQDDTEYDDDEYVEDGDDEYVEDGEYDASQGIPYWTVNLFNYIWLSLLLFIIFFEVFSLALRQMSKDPNRDLISCFKN